MLAVYSSWLQICVADAMRRRVQCYDWLSEAIVMMGDEKPLQWRVIRSHRNAGWLEAIAMTGD